MSTEVFRGTPHVATIRDSLRFAAQRITEAEEALGRGEVPSMDSIREELALARLNLLAQETRFAALRRRIAESPLNGATSA